MKKISRSQIPTVIPLGDTFVVWLVLDHVNASPFQRGVAWALVAIGWIIVLVDICTSDEVKLNL